MRRLRQTSTYFDSAAAAAPIAAVFQVALSLATGITKNRMSAVISHESELGGTRTIAAHRYVTVPHTTITVTRDLSSSDGA